MLIVFHTEDSYLLWVKYTHLRIVQVRFAALQKHCRSAWGASGAYDIAVMWKNHFQRLYSVGAETKYRSLSAEKLSILPNAVEDNSCMFSMSDITYVIA